MVDDSSKQISIRFSESDWERIVIAAAKYGLKPVQYIRTCVIQRLNGSLVDAGTVDEILLRERSERSQRRSF